MENLTKGYFGTYDERSSYSCGTNYCIYCQYDCTRDRHLAQNISEIDIKKAAAPGPS